MRLVREGLRPQFVCELSEFVEIDARPEPKGMRRGLRRAAASSGGRVAQPGADRAIDGFLEGDAEFLGALLPAKSSSSVRVVRMPNIMGRPTS
jgi:hypothetical protein